MFRTLLKVFYEMEWTGTEKNGFAYQPFSCQTIYKSVYLKLLVSLKMAPEVV